MQMWRGFVFPNALHVVAIVHMKVGRQDLIVFNWKCLHDMAIREPLLFTGSY